MRETLPGARSCFPVGLITTVRTRYAAPIFHHGLVALRRSPLASAGAPSATAFAADRSHVFAIAAHCLAAFAPGDASFVGGPLVSGPFLMSRAAALAGNLSLPHPIHRRKAAVTGARSFLTRAPTTGIRTLHPTLAVSVDPVHHASPLATSYVASADLGTPRPRKSETTHAFSSLPDATRRFRPSAPSAPSGIHLFLPGRREHLTAYAAPTPQY